MPFAELDARRKLLAAVALLLILVHLFAPSAGVDDTSVLLLFFLAAVLYGNELTAWLARLAARAAQPDAEQCASPRPGPADERAPDRRPLALRRAPERREMPTAPAARNAPAHPTASDAAPRRRRPRDRDGDSDLQARIRQVAYQVEQARVAAATEELPNGRLYAEVVDQIIVRSQGQPRAAVLLLWNALEERLRAVTGARDSVSAARRLVEGGRAPRQFAEAFDAFRRLRNEVAQGAQQVDEIVLWSIVDIGASLMALVPGEVMQQSEERSWLP
ncbi:MAG: hypothetical protein AB7Y46_12495 [Armatimonadota bacterium]